MGFWSSIGLVSHKEIQQMKTELAIEQTNLKREIHALFQELHHHQEGALEKLTFSFEESLNNLETINRQLNERVLTRINETNSKISTHFYEVNEQGQSLTRKIDTLQEIVKVHWANTLLDYIDELLEDVELKQQNNGEPIHPLSYEFGEISNLFHSIYEATESSGLSVGWKDRKHTLQIYLREEDEKTYKNQVGAIQYEGSNDFTKKPPHTVSWRFIRQNMPDKMVRDISTILSNEQADTLLHGKDEVIVFKFKQDTPATRLKIKKITQALRKDLLMMG